MEQWFQQNPLTLAILGGGLALFLLVVAVVLFVLWRLARAAAAAIEFDATAATRDRLELELALAEQTGRLRIVRELSELVVHSTSVIVSQADGARFAAGQNPQVAARAAGVIADTARTTLSDLRRVLALTREGEAVAGPQPGLGSIRELFSVMRDSGLEVEFRETGSALDLKDGAELAIYRILHEALGNALGHGGQGTRAVVTFTWTAEGLEVVVDDDGVRAQARRNGLDPDQEAQQRTYTQEDDLAALTRPPFGRGITEMRERVELFGGVFRAGPVPGVGFTVLAIFPALRGHNGISGVRLGE